MLAFDFTVEEVAAVASPTHSEILASDNIIHPVTRLRSDTVMLVI
jgi:hypothetical protein